MRQRFALRLIRLDWLLIVVVMSGVAHAELPIVGCVVSKEVIMIRGIVEHGIVRLLDAVPSEWPEGQEIQIEPVRAIQTDRRTKRGRSAEEVHRILNFNSPAPDDATIERWIDEYRVGKYGQ